MSVEPNLDQILHNLEEKAEDELSFFFATGPEYFSTEQLRYLKGQWEIKNQYFHKRYKIWNRIGTMAPIWLCIWLVFDLLGAPIIGLFFLFFFPLSIIAFYTGMVLMRQRFSGTGHLDMIGEIISEELRKRQGLHKE